MVILADINTRAMENKTSNAVKGRKMLDRTLICVARSLGRTQGKGNAKDQPVVNVG